MARLSMKDAKGIRKAWLSLPYRVRRFVLMLLVVGVVWCITSISEKMSWDSSVGQYVPQVGQEQQIQATSSADSLPEWTGDPVSVLDDNVPGFTHADVMGAMTGYEWYPVLDELGRCQAVEALVGVETMPAYGEVRGDISSVRPSGWTNTKYTFVDQGYLYNRCHLIGWQLTGENGNERNLVTGTRYMNVEGMLPYENKVASYVYETGNHVLYRVTPVFVGDELVCRGVEMEAMSVEDEGAGVSFHVFAHNVQPGVSISYADGSNHADRAASQ